MSRSRADLGFRRWLTALFDQQMWCLGRDIARSSGNLLLDLGLCQYRPRTPDDGSTMYTAAVPPGGNLFLWGFGALYVEAGQGGVFVRRYDFAPKLTVRETAWGVHKPEQLGPLLNPSRPSELARLRRLLPHLVGWFAKYEHWIAENYGADYRQLCLAMREQPTVMSATDLAREWERAEKKCRRFRLPSPVAATPWDALLARFRPTTKSCRILPTRPSTRVSQ